MFKLQFSETSVEQVLTSLRLNPDAVWPEPKYLSLAPISLESDWSIWQAFLGAHGHLLSLATSIGDRTVVVDLDETLLINSHICPELWSLGCGYADPAIYSAYQYANMHKSWKGYLRHAVGRAAYHTVDARSYPFVNNPRQIVMFRPGVLAGLAWLKAQGVRLILATASARPRVDYLLQKFPLLAEIFADHIITANDIACHYLSTAQQHSTYADPASAQVHHLRPHSLAAKTPALVSALLQVAPYDLIVDDSVTTAELFNQTSLSRKLLWVRSDLPTEGYGLRIMAEIVTRLAQGPSERDINRTERLQPDVACDRFVGPGYVSTRLEDPYYWPLCHASDQLHIKLESDNFMF